MAISYLGSVTGVAGGSLSLTSLGLQEDDFLFAIQVQDTGTTVTPISGWTNYFDEPRVNVKLVEDYLVCGSSPPTSVTVSGDSSTSVIIAGFRGVDPAAPFDTTSRTALGEDNANLNPPSITTIGDNSYVIAVGGLDDDLVESNVTAPTGYTLVAAKEAGGGQTAMMAYKEVSTAGVEDPGTFGIGSGNDDWIARTHSLRAEGVNPPWTLIDEVTEEIAPGAGNATVNLPTSAEGDIVVFILGTDSGLSTPAITDSGWNLEQFSDDECCIGWKVMGSTPDTTVTVPRTLDRYAAFAAQAYRGGDGTQPDAALQTAIGSSSVPDPPSITTATDDALVIAFGQLDDEVITFTAPSGYGRLVEANTPSASSPGNDGASVVIASRRVPTAGTENPGTFAAIQNDNWYGATIAFTLAVGGGTTVTSSGATTTAAVTASGTADNFSTITSSGTVSTGATEASGTATTDNGQGTPTVDLGEWTGGSASILPSDSWAAPNGMFPTEARNDNSVYSFSSSNSTLTLPSSDLADGYLIVGGFEFEDSSNGRFNPQGRFIQASGTGNFISAQAGGYNRDASEDRSFVRVWAFIDNPSASAEIEFQWKRDADTATGGTVRSHLQVIPFYYSNIGMYSSATTPNSSTTPTKLTGFSTTTESSASAIEIASDTVTLKGDNKRYLCLGSYFVEGVGGRTQRWGGFRVDGTLENAARGYSYYRDSSNDENGEMFSWLVDRATTDITVDIATFRGEAVGSFPNTGADGGGSAGSNASNAFLVLELNDSAKVFRTTNSQQEDLTTAGTLVDLDIASVGDIDFNDSDIFTRGTDTGIDVAADTNVLLGANVSGGYNSSTGARYTGYSEFTVGGTGETYSASGDYARGDQGTIDTWGWSSNNLSFHSVTSGQDVGIHAGKIAGGEAGTVHALSGWVGFWGIDLSTLQDVVGGPVTSTGTPSVAAVTASGSADNFSTVTSNGTPTVTAVTASGVGEREITSSGSVATGATEASGTGTNSAEITSSGAVDLPAVTSSGVGEREITSSGVITVASTAAGGVGSNFSTITSSGTPSFAAVSASGVGEREVTSSGTVTSGPIESSGTGTNTSEITSSGSIDLPAVTSSGVGEREVTSSGSATTPATNANGFATNSGQTNATGNPSIPATTASGVGEREITSSGAVDTPSVTADGTGTNTSEITSSGSVSLSSVTASGLGSIQGQASSSGSVTLSPITVSGVGEREITSSGTVVAGGVETSGTGTNNSEIASSGAVNLSPAVASGVGEREVTSSGSSTTGATEAAGAANNTGEVTSSGAATTAPVEALGVSGNAKVSTGEVTTGSVTASGTGTREISASGAVVIPITTASGAAEREVTSSGTIILPPTSAEGSVTRVVVVSGDISVVAITAIGQGILLGDSVRRTESPDKPYNNIDITNPNNAVTLVGESKNRVEVANLNNQVTIDGPHNRITLANSGVRKL